MSKNIYGKRQGIPLSNKILLVASIVCVIAAVVVFVFFNKHQKDRNNDIILNGTPAANTGGNAGEATPTPNGDPVVPSASTISGRFNPPAGYERIQIETDSFAEYLRNFTLREYGVKPLTYDPNTKTLVNDDAAPSASVLAMDLINKGNLQQSSDSILRLYAEYLYSKGRYTDISFNLLTTPAFQCDFDTWSKGGRLDLSKINENNQISWCIDHTETCGHKDVEIGTSAGTFRYYLQNVMTYSDTASLVTNMSKLSGAGDAAIGDVIIYAGSQDAPAVIVDMAVNHSDGSKVYMMAQGGSPATEIYIVQGTDTPWHSIADLSTGASVYRFK